jgi:acyl transferase domain-containing protein/acyl carrier protein/short-subunit dehydrogenase
MQSIADYKYAVVGLGGLFPGASSIDQYWKNILEKKVFIEEIPDDSIERKIFFRPEVLNQVNKKDRSYTSVWATIRDEEINFNPGQFRLPPTIAARMDRNQKLSLLSASQATSNGCIQNIAKERVSVFMGNSGGGVTHSDLITRFSMDKFEYLLNEQALFCERLSPPERQELLNGVRKQVVCNDLVVNEDTAPGMLPNIIAARVNSVFDLHGHAFVVDAACASGLAAIIVGLQQLRLGEADAVICGASDWSNKEDGRIYFSGIGALSPDGSFPFDERANGFVVGDGAGMAVIKRLEDAIAAKDRIYAVIAGYGQASDGKGKAVAAPNEVWQANTIQRAWEMAGVDINTVELIEAHGTSTQVGDLSEVNALKRAFTSLGATRSDYCGIGSVKSNIGHLKSAAGIAGFIKTAMAIDQKMLPPTAGFVKENPKLKLQSSPFYVNAEAREWSPRPHPRRAGVSAFGFGGADYHIAMEEYRESDYSGLGRKSERAVFDLSLGPGSNGKHHRPGGFEGGSQEPEYRAALESTEAAQRSWPQPVFFSGETTQDIQEQLRLFTQEAARSPRGIVEQALLQNLRVKSGASARLAFPFTSPQDLQAKQALVQDLLQDPSGILALTARGIYFQCGAPVQSHEVVAMFPGQGSQYPEMLLPLARHYAAAHQTFVRADALWKESSGTTVSDLIDAFVRGTDATDALLRKTQNTHPSLVVSSLASYQVLEEMGFRPGTMIGHSVGEFSALAAARRLTFVDAMRVVHARAQSFSAVAPEKAGAMLAVSVDTSEASRLIERAGVEMAIANINSWSQTILSGEGTIVDRMLGYCQENGIKASKLNVSHAFHSPLMEPAERAFRAALDETRFLPGTSRVIANRTNTFYAETSDQVRGELYEQITGKVAFAASIQRLHDEGARLFVEVGPGSVLTQLTRDILKDASVTVLSSDNKRGDSSEAFERMICGLFAAGLDIDPSAASLRAPARTGENALSEITPVTGVANENAFREQADGTGDLKLVYSGVSVGLPGSYKTSFRDDNFKQLFEGRNFIERLTDDERQQLVDLNITKVVKSEQGASFATLTALNEVIQLAGKVGRLDLAKDYGIDEKDIKNMSTAIAHAVAAGYEALHDAHIPLVHEYVRTAGGSLLPERWSLPKEMQRSTGVIFANGFPMVDPIIKEVSRSLSHHFGSRIRAELFEFYDTLISQISDRNARKLLSDWYCLNQNRLSAKLSSEEIYQFNHQLMTQISMQANNRLARAINARGPNFQINAACSSTCTAISLAEDLIRNGRAKRMIVIGADDPCSDNALPFLGGGFLSTGACTNEGNLYEAALPFDRRRNGMIMGSGAVSIIVEMDSECKRRGVIPVCEVLGSHCFNAAGHGSQLDVPRYADELEAFMQRMEKRHSLDRRKLAPRLLYMSHETYTPPRGGCAEAEAVALKHVFGVGHQEIEISNTKGMTGHTMGASIEDAAAAKALQFGQAPPVVNHQQSDPGFEGLKLSGGDPAPFEYALRMAAGFGSQGNYILLKRRAQGVQRIQDEQIHTQWLREVSGLPEPEVILKGRTLVIKDEKPGTIIVDRPNIATAPEQASSSKPSLSGSPANVMAVSSGPALVQPSRPTVAAGAPPTSPKSARNTTKPNYQALVFEIVAQVTGYDASILEPNMELEADLGIDTVKQATVLAMLAERLGMADPATMRISDYPALEHIVDFCEKHTEGSVYVEAPQEQPVTPVQAVPPVHASSRESEHAEQTILAVISDVTGYPVSILTPEMELEADLGIDTVKQATILSMLAERFEMAAEEESEWAMRMSDFSSIAKLISFFQARKTSVQKAASGLKEDVAPPPRREEEFVAYASTQAQQKSNQREGAPQHLLHGEGSTPHRLARFNSLEDVTNEIHLILGEVASYPREMLESDLNLKSDLQLSSKANARFSDELHSTFDLHPGSYTSQDETLGQLAHRIWKSLQEKSGAASPSQALGRQILELRATPDVIPGALSLEGKQIWVLGDASESVSLIASWARAKGGHALEIVIPASGQPDEVTSRLEELFDGNLPQVLIDLTASPACHDICETEPELIHPAISRAADCRFAVFRWLTAKQAAVVRILAVTTLDGQFALREDSAVPSGKAIYGLHLGFYKALRKEWPDSFVSIVDLAPAAWESEASEALRIIEAEVCGKGQGAEVCHIQGRRHQLVVEDSCMEAIGDRGGILPTDVIVATGGAAGITGRIILEWMKQAPASVALIGRTQPDPDADGLLNATDAEKADLKLRIKQRLSTSGKRVTPKQIQQEYDRLERCAEINCTLKSLREMGCNVRYFQADVCDLNSMKSALEETRKQLGPITVLLHGAGLEVSHLIPQKTPKEFRTVHAVKSVGAYNLNWLCRTDPVRRSVAISSISGRFGNAAQLDYSAANEFLNLMARCERRPGVRATSLLWSGWSGLGMAHRNSFVQEHAESMGLNLIAPDAGAQVAIREIFAHHGPTEVVLHRGLPGVADQEQVALSLDAFPMIDWVDRRSGIVTHAHRRFSPARDEFLNQHRFAGIPLMPGVGFQEMMAETAKLITGCVEPAEYVFHDLKFLDAFKLHREEPRDVQLRVMPQEPSDIYRMVVSSSVKTKIRETTKDYASAGVQIRPRTNATFDPEKFRLQFKHDSKDLSEVLDRKQRPQDVKLGPLFNEARQPNAQKPTRIRWSEQGIETWVPLPVAQLNNPRYPRTGFLINPSFLDALHQAGAMLSIALTDEVYLPVGAQKFIVHESPNQDAHYTVIAKVLTLDETQLTYDMVMLNEAGLPCVTIENSWFRRVTQ